MKRCILGLMFILAIVPAAVAAEISLPDAKVYIVWPSDGAIIKGGKFWLRMGLKGMGIAPAGVIFPGTGHHHVIVDSDLPPMDGAVPNDTNHLHFGKGQTEAVITLSKGVHTLQLDFADKEHMQFDPPLLSRKITITVK